MNVPPSGSPKPTSAANWLILKPAIEVVEVTRVWSLNPAGWLKRRKTYLQDVTGWVSTSIFSTLNSPVWVWTSWRSWLPEFGNRRGSIQQISRVGNEEISPQEMPDLSTGRILWSGCIKVNRSDYEWSSRWHGGVSDCERWRPSGSFHYWTSSAVKLGRSMKRRYHHEAVGVLHGRALVHQRFGGKRARKGHLARRQWLRLRGSKEQE